MEARLSGLANQLVVDEEHQWLSLKVEPACRKSNTIYQGVKNERLHMFQIIGLYFPAFDRSRNTGGTLSVAAQAKTLKVLFVSLLSLSFTRRLGLTNSDPTRSDLEQQHQP